MLYINISLQKKINLFEYLMFLSKIYKFFSAWSLTNQPTESGWPSSSVAEDTSNQNPMEFSLSKFKEIKPFVPGKMWMVSLVFPINPKHLLAELSIFGKEGRIHY